MDKLVLTKQFLTEMTSADDETINSYYQYALEGRIAATERPAIVAFLMELIIRKTRKMIEKQGMNPFHFFGISNDHYQQHMDLLQRTDYEIAFCLIENANIPEKAIADFATDYAFFLFWQGRYFDCLAKCQNALVRDPNNFMCNFMKSAIVEMCLINQTPDAYKIALLNYQKSRIDLCDEKACNVDKMIFEKVREIIECNYNALPEDARALSFDVVSSDLLVAQQQFPAWTEEHEFYLQHRLFLNPLCDFERFVQATYEELLPLPIDSEYQAMFDELINDYKLCRSLAFAYCKGIYNVGKREMGMVYSYAYSIFDKLAYVIAKNYQLEVGDDNIYFTKPKLFDKNIRGQDICFGHIRNANIYPLLCVANAAKVKNKTTNQICNQIRPGTWEINELRNQIDHKSLYLVDEDKLKRNATVLLGLVRKGILYTYLLLNSFSNDDSNYMQPSAYSTTYMQALTEIMKSK